MVGVTSSWWRRIAVHHQRPHRSRTQLRSERADLADLLAAENARVEARGQRWPR
jgi:hypothetical protein